MTDSTPATLVQALVSAKKAMSPLLKNSTNPHFKNRYADLTATLDVAEVLGDFGILMTQYIDMVEGQTVLITRLSHVTDDAILESTYPIRTKDDNNPQNIGSAITYARRYSLLSMLGISAEDDDGNKAATPPKSLRTKLSEALKAAGVTTKDQAAEALLKQFGEGKTIDKLTDAEIRSWIKVLESSEVVPF